MWRAERQHDIGSMFGEDDPPKASRPRAQRAVGGTLVEVVKWLTASSGGRLVEAKAFTGFLLLLGCLKN